MISPIYNPIPNKYYCWYISIITKAQSRGWTKKTAPCYVESHHIVPKSLGGDNSKENLVCLTAKEHYICHKLLVMFLNGASQKKMISAMWILCNRSRIKNARDFDQFKNLKSQMLKKLYVGKGNPMYGKTLTREHKEKISLNLKGHNTSQKTRKKISLYHKGRKFTEEHKEKLSLAKKGHIPWNKGKKSGKPAWNKGIKGTQSGEKNSFYGKQHSEETKRKISETKKLQHQMKIIQKCHS